MCGRFVVYWIGVIRLLSRKCICENVFKWLLVSIRLVDSIIVKNSCSCREGFWLKIGFI